jgi:hypothetical protein
VAAGEPVVGFHCMCRSSCMRCLTSTHSGQNNRLPFTQPVPGEPGNRVCVFAHARPPPAACITAKTRVRLVTLQATADVESLGEREREVSKELEQTQVSTDTFWEQALASWHGHGGTVLATCFGIFSA